MFRDLREELLVVRRRLDVAATLRRQQLLVRGACGLDGRIRRRTYGATLAHGDGFAVQHDLGVAELRHYTSRSPISAAFSVIILKRAATSLPISSLIVRSVARR